MLLRIIKELQVFRVGQVHGSRSVRDMLMSSSSGCRSLHVPQPTVNVLQSLPDRIALVCEFSLHELNKDVNVAQKAMWFCSSALTLLSSKSTTCVFSDGAGRERAGASRGAAPAGDQIPVDAVSPTSTSFSSFIIRHDTCESPTSTSTTIIMIVPSINDGWWRLSVRLRLDGFVGPTLHM